MKITEIRTEGASTPKFIRPTIEMDNGHQVMLGFTNVDDIDTVFAAQSVEYGETAPDTTQLKALLVLLPSMTDNIVIKDDTVFVQEEGKPKTFKQTITPLCASTGMEAICAIVHTPEVKQAYIDAQPPKQKTSKVTKPYSRIEMVDGGVVCQC
jgi:secreted protein with Ig-like and vWFA domain